MREQFVSKDNNVYYIEKSNEKPFPESLEFNADGILSYGKEFIMIYAYPVLTMETPKLFVRWEITYASENDVERFAEHYKRAWNVHPWLIYRRVA